VSHPQPEQRSTSRPLDEAQQALKRGAWEEARRRFEGALAEEETPEALEGLGAAAWWLEDAPAVFASRERAYRLFRGRGDRRAAGRVAAQVGYDYAVFRAESAVSNGWLQRAHRLLDDLDPVPEHVLLALTEAELAYHGEGDLEHVRRLAVRAKELAGHLGLFDLELVGLAVEGLALVGLGEVADGMRRLDEATAAAVAGDMEDFQSVAATLCIMVFACERVQDVDRAGQWCDRYMAFCIRNGLRAQLALCRVQYASVLTARGRWAEAEGQLAQALDGLRCRVAWSLPALERLGELRRRQGRLEDAEEHFERAHPVGLLGKARVALDRGDHETALDLVERMLRRLSDRGPLERSAPLELLVRIHCERGEVQEAEEALKELEAIAGVVRTACLLALASHGRGRVALAAGDAVAAKAHLEDALDLYEGGRLPFEAALVRLDLGRALHAGGRRGPALDRCRTAREAFRSLGAAAQAARAEALADGLARADRPMPDPGGLSPREMEVLALLTRGLSNEEIAAELVLSKHTVRRHVSNILTKLDVPSRTAAAVYALEHPRT
jgi:LuxR family transcriptional regulator, maltose regulon positive regulatory protein